MQSGITPPTALCLGRNLSRALWRRAATGHELPGPHDECMSQLRNHQREVSALDMRWPAHLGAATPGPVEKLPCSVSCSRARDARQGMVWDNMGVSAPMGRVHDCVADRKYLRGQLLIWGLEPFCLCANVETLG